MTHAVLRGDHHVHSTFSDDAVSTLAQNVDAAVAAGLTTLRLVDHVRQSTTWVPEYLAAVRALRVPDGLTVLSGVEAKILDAAGSLDIPVLPEGIDRILIADHQFPGTDGLPRPLDRARSDRRGVGPGRRAGSVRRRAHRDHASVPGNQLAHCFSILPKIGLSEPRSRPGAHAGVGASPRRRPTPWSRSLRSGGAPGVEALSALRARRVE